MLSSLYLNASSKYYITYDDMTLGKLTNINTIKDGYLVAVPTSSWLKFVFNFDNYIVYEENKKPKITGKNKYSKDKHYILELVNTLSKNRKEFQEFKRNDNLITIRCENNTCNYTRYNEIKKEKYKGILKFNSDNTLKMICDYKSDICIEQN